MAIGTSNGFSGPYTGNGSTTAFPFTFSVLSGDQVAVQVDGATVSSSEYSVSLSSAAPSIGTVTFAIAPANGTTIYTYLNPEFTQDIEFADGAAWLAKPVNDGYDQSALRDQALKRDVSRALLLPIGDSSSALPATNDRKGGYLAFDADGKPVIASGTGNDPDFRSDASQVAGATLVGADDGADGATFTTVQDFITKILSSVGASIIGFIQTGTGAVMRLLQDKLRDNVSVKDFGAKGDGSTDDSTAFSNAFATGREVILPAGNYKITPRAFSDLTSLKIRGCGRDVTKITLSSTGTALTFSNCQWLQMSDLSIQATGTAQSLADAIGVQFDTGSSNCVVERVNFYGFSLDGLRMVGTALSPLSGNTVRDCYFLGCGRHQVYEYYNNDATWDNAQIGKLAGITHATFGWYRENCGETGISSVKVWENFRGYKALNCTGTRHNACRIELSDYENVWIEGGYDNIIDGCRFYSASQNGNGLYDNVYFKNTFRPTLSNSSIVTWDATYSKWGVNFDGTCDDMTVVGNTINGFDAANFGPIRFGGNVTRVTGDLVVWFTETAVSAGSTSYPSNGSSTAEAAAYRTMNRQYAAVKLYAATDAAPGAAQTYTYTLRKNGADTAMTCQSAGASSFSAITTSPSPQITYDEGDFLAVKLVTSGTAAVANHRGHIILVAY